MWNDRIFWASVRATLTYAVILVPLFQLLSFSMALLLNSNDPGNSLFSAPPFTFRSWCRLPRPRSCGDSSSILSSVLLNYVLRELGFDKILWFQEPRYAMTAMVIMSLWVFGGTMVIYLAALQGVPEHLYEAAALDGASALRRLFVVTIPMMSPVIFFNFVLGVIGALQIFTQAYIITDGGPAKRHSLLLIDDLPEGVP